MTDAEVRIDELYDRALETMRMIASTEDEDDLGPVLSWLDDLEDIVDEAEDILEHVDLTDLVDAVDWSEVPEAFDADDVQAMLDSDEDVSLTKLLKIVDMTELWGSVDAREVWREKREFDDELADITGSEGDNQGGEKTQMSMPNVDLDDYDPETAENAIQSQLSGSVDEFRDALLDAHVRLEAFREQNKKRFTDRRRRRSRNPTAVSTLPPGRDSLGQGTRFSTVPKETKYSTAPNRERIYGNRFERAIEMRDE